MATHSSVLAWRIPGTAEPGGLLSMGSQSWTWLKQLSSSSSSSIVPDRCFLLITTIMMILAMMTMISTVDKCKRQMWKQPVSKKLLFIQKVFTEQLFCGYDIAQGSVRGEEKVSTPRKAWWSFQLNPGWVETPRAVFGFFRPQNDQ